MKICFQSRLTWLISATFVIISSLPGNAGCYDNNTGLAGIPTALVDEHLIFETGIYVDYYRGVNSDGTTYRESAEDMWAEVGLFNCLQLGGILISFSSEYILFNAGAKLQIFKEGKWPGVAVGIHDVMLNDRLKTEWDYPYEKNQENSVYVVLSKRFSILPQIPMSVHLGIGNQDFRSEAPSFKNLYGIFCGVVVSPVHDLDVIADEDGRGVNFGLHYYIGMGFTPVLYLLNAIKGPDRFNEGARAVKFAVSFSNTGIKSKVGELAAELDMVKDELAAVDRGEIPEEFSHPAEANAVTVKPETYKVRAGDTLAKIAALPEIYNNPKKWTLIYNANKIILPDPYTLYVGQVLVIPREDQQ